MSVIPEELEEHWWDYPTYDIGTTGALISPTPPDVRYEFMPDCHPIVPEEDYPESAAQLLGRFEDGRALTRAALPAAVSFVCRSCSVGAQGFVLS